MENLLSEAFQRLSLLENDFDFSTIDKNKVDELSEFVADDVEEIPEEPIIDVEAENEEDLADNYIGKVILECECCHSRIYKDEEDVIIDPESGVANIDEQCPVCNNSLGYLVIGKIEAFNSEKEIKPEEEEVPEDELAPEDEESEEEAEEVDLESDEDTKEESLKNNKLASEDSGKLDESVLSLEDRLSRKHLASLLDDDVDESYKLKEGAESGYVIKLDNYNNWVNGGVSTAEFTDNGLNWLKGNHSNQDEVFTSMFKPGEGHIFNTEEEAFNTFAEILDASDEIVSNDDRAEFENDLYVSSEYLHESKFRKNENLEKVDGIFDESCNEDVYDARKAHPYTTMGDSDTDAIFKELEVRLQATIDKIKNSDNAEDGIVVDYDVFNDLAQSAVVYLIDNGGITSEMEEVISEIDDYYRENPEDANEEDKIWEYAHDICHDMMSTEEELEFVKNNYDNIDHIEYNDDDDTYTFYFVDPNKKPLFDLKANVKESCNEDVYDARKAHPYVVNDDEEFMIKLQNKTQKDIARIKNKKNAAKGVRISYDVFNELLEEAIVYLIDKGQTTPEMDDVIAEVNQWYEDNPNQNVGPNAENKIWEYAHDIWHDLLSTEECLELFKNSFDNIDHVKYNNDNNDTYTLYFINPEKRPLFDLKANVKESCNEELLDHGNENLGVEGPAVVKDDKSLEDDQSELVHAAGDKIAPINEGAAEVCPKCGKTPCICEEEVDAENEPDPWGGLTESAGDKVEVVCDECGYEGLMTKEEYEACGGQCPECGEHRGGFGPVEPFDEALDPAEEIAQAARASEEAEKDSLHESVEVNATGENSVNVVKNDDGSLSVNVGADETNPVDDIVPEAEPAETEGEEIVPLEPEEQAEIETNEPEGEVGDNFAEEPVEEPAEVPTEEEPEEGEEEPEEPAEGEEEFEGEESLKHTSGNNLLESIDVIDENRFNKLCETYMKRVYGNVASYKVSSVSMSGTKAIFEGVITFNSGKTKNTTFTFSNPSISKRGKLVMEGFNNTFTKAERPFVLKCIVNGSNLVAESMIYSYTAKQINESNEQESVRIYGRVKA